MVTTTSARFREQLGEQLDIAQREPVTITNRGRRRAVVVSAAFYDEAVAAMEDLEDIRAAALARQEEGIVSHEELLAELDLAD